MNSADPTEPVEVRTLLGRKGLANSLACLGSLVRACAEPVRLTIHEDGSLEESDRDQLRTLAPQVAFVGRPEADARMAEALARHPRCRDARANNILFLKVFDLPLLAGPRLAYSDSDIFFLRPVRRLFAPPAPGVALTFMADIRHAYSLRPWSAAPLGPVRLLGRVNTGLIVWERPAPDLDRVEWLLGRLQGDRGFVTRPFWAEQTVWAAWAADHGAHLWDHQQLVIADAKLSAVGLRTVAIHFVATHRHLLAQYVDRPLADEPPATVAARPARPLTAWGMLASDVRCRLGW